MQRRRDAKFRGINFLFSLRLCEKIEYLAPDTFNKLLNLEKHKNVLYFQKTSTFVKLFIEGKNEK